jgi:hypothetical protein
MMLRRILYRSAATTFVGLCLCGPAPAETITLDDFSDGISPRWQEKSFVGRTSYHLVKDGDRQCVKAVSAGSSSGLYYKLDFDPKQYPLISWSWKIDNILQHGDARTRAGDDYAARVYVIFPSIFFWNTRAINYIWANRLPEGEAIFSSYTKNSVMIAVESGDQAAGQWRNEQRNIAEDYRRFFGQQPPRAGFIALMTDSDNTGEKVSACYGPISISTGENK